MWFQNRRAKWRKKEHTKKGPGRPAHNAHPQSCSGEPIPPEELRRKERERRQKKLLKALERQQRKLAAKVSRKNIFPQFKNFKVPTYATTYQYLLNVSISFGRGTFFYFTCRNYCTWLNDSNRKKIVSLISTILSTIRYIQKVIMRNLI